MIRFLLILCLLLPVSVQALDPPQNAGYVNDRASLLSAPVRLKLEQFLRQFEESDSTQIVVLTIPSLEGEVLEQFSLKVAEKWGIGQQGKDNGALLLIAKQEREVRIEVGYGLEGKLTDLMAGRIIDQEITPRFKNGDFDGGIVSGVAAIAEVVLGEYQGSGSTSRAKKKSPLGLLALLLFLGPGLSLLGGRRRGSRRRSGVFIGGPFIGGGRGGFGGGGFSGGGGGFGGGGSSGSW